MRWVFSLAAVAVAAAQRVAFDAQLGEKTVNFVLEDGDDVEATTAAWCLEHVEEELRARCAAALTQQVEWMLMETSLAPVELTVIVSAGGDEKTFVHEAGADVRYEATVFCKDVAAQTAENMENCVEALVTAAKKKVLQEDQMEEQNDADVWAALFGPALINGRGEAFATGQALGGASFVGVLFAAEWCGPCRAFVPKLIQLYNKAHARKKFEVVWVAGSRDASSYADYLTSSAMPWLAAPFDPQSAHRLQAKFGVRGFPTLVILDAQARLITNQGVAKVAADPNALTLPWRSPAQRLKNLLRTLLDFLNKALLYMKTKNNNRATPAAASS